ncbi:hypothetical protein SLE2022_298190 [Rubroshorea leprosula]
MEGPRWSSQHFIPGCSEEMLLHNGDGDTRFQCNQRLRRIRVDLLKGICTISAGNRRFGLLKGCPEFQQERGRHS